MRIALIALLLVVGACSHGKKGCENCAKEKKEVVAAPVEFEGHCAMGLCHKKSAKVKCDPNITAAYKGKNYCFSTTEARDAFMKDIDSNVKKAHQTWNSIGGPPRG